MPTSTKRTQPYGIEDVESALDAHQVFFQHNHHHKPHNGGDGIPRVEHPERIALQENISYSAAAYGCDKSYGIGSKPVKLLDGSKSHATYCIKQGRQDLEKVFKGTHHLLYVGLCIHLANANVTIFH
jgi:hypothetical protein